MLEKVFRHPSVLKRLRGGVLGGALDDLAAYLLGRGHTLTTVQMYLRGAGHFSYWLQLERIPAVSLREEVVGHFLQKHLRACRCPVPFGEPVSCMRAVMGHLMLVLRRSGRIAPARPMEPRPADAMLEAFEAYLRETRGATSKTCVEYTRYVREFLESVEINAPGDISILGPRDVMDFVASRAACCKPATAKLVATALRSFLRFQQMQGLCGAELTEAVPTVPRWRLSQIPTTLSDDQVRTLLTSFNRSTGIGRRDYAMALCLVQLALRAGEVARLSLDDINWRSGTMRIAAGKVRRAGSLPLPAPVGRAIVAYLRRGRPGTRERLIFLRHILPVGGPIDAGAVRAAMRRGFERAGVRVPSKGTHALRHTAATRMIRAGASIKEVADVLRHRCIDTTAIYTKVDLPRLADVALAFPKAKP
jgi:site-specific recombinase XerD